MLIIIKMYNYLYTYNLFNDVEPNTKFISDCVK